MSMITDALAEMSASERLYVCKTLNRVPRIADIELCLTKGTIDVEYANDTLAIRYKRLGLHASSQATWQYCGRNRAISP